MQQAEGVETSWEEEEHPLYRSASLNAKLQEFEDELDRKKVFENLKKVLLCATLETEKSSVAAISLGQRYEARVRQLEELLAICQRERDEARDECLRLRQRLAHGRSFAGGSADQSMAGRWNALQSQQQQQFHHGSTGLQRNGLSRRRSRSLEGTASIHWDHQKVPNLNDLRQQSLQPGQPESESRRPPPRPVHVEMQTNSPDAQSSLTSSLHMDVRSSDDQHSLMIESTQNVHLAAGSRGGMGRTSSQSLQHVPLGRRTSNLDLQRALTLPPQEQIGFQEHLHQAPPDSGQQQRHQQQLQQLQQQEQGHRHPQQQQQQEPQHTLQRQESQHILQRQESQHNLQRQKSHHNLHQLLQQQEPQHNLHPQQLQQESQHNLHQQHQQQQQESQHNLLQKQQQQQQESQHNLHQQEASDAHLHGHSSYNDSASNFNVPSFSSTTPASSDILAGLHPGGGFVAESASSSSLLQRQHSVHLPEPPEADLQVMLSSLPEKGQLLQAVMQAGPLLQTLMLAGPLPQWRRPPPAVASVQIPKVAISSGVSSRDMPKASGSLSTSYG